MPSTIGDNSSRIIADQLQVYLEHLERLDAEKKDIAKIQKEVFGEAKAMGYDVSIIRKILALRKRDPDDVAEEETVLKLYKEALGM